MTFDNGYYDQQHFIHDFNNFTGLVPIDFFNTNNKTIFYNFYRQMHLIFTAKKV